MTIELQQVSKTFRSQAGPIKAVEGMSLTIPEGQFLCMVGSSGCGKTTFLNLLAGLEIPETGNILFRGNRITGPDRNRVMLFQQPALFPWLRVGQNVEFGLRMSGVPRIERLPIVARLLDLVKLSKFIRSFPHELSGGMKQRVALAAGLAIDPAVLLMDEPFAALDAQTRDELHDELEAIWLKTRKTIVFVTHNVREAARLADRVALMTSEGRIVKEYEISLPRPRHIEDAEVAKMAAAIRDDLKRDSRPEVMP
ncbi:MAG: ABC transporter ATP-binding protein [Candidatus Ozemobacteraceae bacterium]